MNVKAIYLVQTDTTVGFLSQDVEKLLHVKERDGTKNFVKVYSDFKSFKEDKNRIHNSHKRYVRYCKKTTFISKNRASRIVSSGTHHNFLKRFSYMYSTSANKTTQPFDENFAKEVAEIIVQQRSSFNENRASKMIKLSHTNTKRLR